MVATNASHDDLAKVGSLVHDLRIGIYGPEGCGDKNLSILEFLVELITFVGCSHDEFVPLALYKIPHAEVRCAQLAFRATRNWLSCPVSVLNPVIMARVKNCNDLHGVFPPLQYCSLPRYTLCASSVKP